MTETLSVTCASVAADLVAHLDGEYTTYQSAEIEAHLAGCQDCRRHAALLARSWSLVEQLSQPVPPPSLRGRDFAAAVIAKAQWAPLEAHDRCPGVHSLPAVSSSRMAERTAAGKPMLTFVPADRVDASPAQPGTTRPRSALRIWRYRVLTATAVAAVLVLLVLPTGVFGPSRASAPHREAFPELGINDTTSHPSASHPSASHPSASHPSVSHPSVSTSNLLRGRSERDNPSSIIKTPSGLSDLASKNKPLKLPRTQDVVPPQLRDLDALREKFATGEREQFFTHELRGPDPLLDVLARDDTMNETKMMLKVMDLGGMVIMEGKNNLGVEVQEN